MTETLEVFGKCQRCGGSGGDYTAGLTGADAQSNLSSTPQGELLEYFEGILMCRVCIQTEKMRQQSIVDAERQAQEDAFRARVGFKRTI